jgi:hypothetical protein
MCGLAMLHSLFLASQSGYLRCSYVDGMFPVCLCGSIGVGICDQERAREIVGESDQHIVVTA